MTRLVLASPRARSRFLLLAFAFALGALAGCVNTVGPDDPFLDAPGDVVDQGVIIGDLDWIEASTLPAGSADRRAADASGFVSIPGRGMRCSGFLVAPDVVMTNQHCVSDAAMAFGVTVNFRFETIWDESGVYVCDRFIGADAALDYALLRCEGRPGERFGVLSLDERLPAENTRIALLHQQCDWYSDPDCAPTKKLSPGVLGMRSGSRVLHTADMLGGSSGGAIVLAGTTRVVAINRGHRVDDPTTGRGGRNAGVSMGSIGPHIRAHFPEALSACPPVPTAGAILEEDDVCTTLGGASHTLVAVEDRGHGGDLVHTGTIASTTASANSNFAEWRLVPAVAGRYEVAVYVDADLPTSRAARYRLTHAGRTDTVVVDQAAVTASGFVSLGVFDFTRASDQRLRLDDATGESGRRLAFDAVRMLPAPADAPAPATPPETQPGPPDTPSPEAPAPEEAPPPAAPDGCPRLRVVNATSLNVRPDPSTAQAPLGTLAGDEVVDRIETALGQQVGETATWHHIEKPGLNGWVSGAFMVCVE